MRAIERKRERQKSKEFFPPFEGTNTNGFGTAGFLGTFLQMPLIICCFSFHLLQASSAHAVVCSSNPNATTGAPVNEWRYRWPLLNKVELRHIYLGTKKRLLFGGLRGACWCCDHVAHRSCLQGRRGWHVMTALMVYDKRA